MSKRNLDLNLLLYTINLNIKRRSKMSITVQDMIEVLSSYPKDTVLVVSCEGDNSAAVIESVHDAWLVGPVSLHENVVCLTVATSTIEHIKNEQGSGYKIQGQKKIFGGTELPEINYGIDTVSANYDHL